MTFLRSLRDDLVEKRLWPIALLLLLTAVAVPVVLGHAGRDGGGAAPAIAPAPAPGVAGATPAVQVVGPPAVRARAGKVRDPFRRAAKAAATVATVDGAPAAPSSASKTVTSTKSGGTAAPATATTTTPATPTEPGGAPPAPAPAAAGAVASVYRTRVRWGSDATADIRGLSRLEALGGLSDPALLYLGTTKDHAKAVFLLGPNAIAGDASACAETTCRVIALKAGASATVGVVGTDGAAARRFELVVASIPEIAAADEAAATALRARVDADGRAVLRTMIKDPKTATAIGQFSYDRRAGAVVAKAAP
jgi:hypothetical protein